MDIPQEVMTLLGHAGFPVTPEEIAHSEVCDFGLGRFRLEGACMIPIASTARLSMKVLVLLPGQVLPEHRHVPFDAHRAKEEFLRALHGELYLYTPGQDAPVARIPDGKAEVYTCRRETVLRPGQQAYLPAGMAHWFAAGSEGCVALSFSSEAKDQSDVFTDPEVIR